MVRILKEQDIKTTSKKANEEQSVKHNTCNKVKILAENRVWWWHLVNALCFY